MLERPAARHIETGARTSTVLLRDEEICQAADAAADAAGNRRGRGEAEVVVAEEGLTRRIQQPRCGRNVRAN
jgi:hypothetical protein